MVPPTHLQEVAATVLDRMFSAREAHSGWKQIHFVFSAEPSRGALSRNVGMFAGGRVEFWSKQAGMHTWLALFESKDWRLKNLTEICSLGDFGDLTLNFDSIDKIDTCTYPWSGINTSLFIHQKRIIPSAWDTSTSTSVFGKRTLIFLRQAENQYFQRF